MEKLWLCFPCFRLECLLLALIIIVLNAFLYCCSVSVMKAFQFAPFVIGVGCSEFVCSIGQFGYNDWVVVVAGVGV